MAMSSFSSNEDNKSNVVSSVSWEYTGEVLCNCGLKCPMWTTWKRKNAGRRFFSCPNFKNSDCKFFRWHDEDMSDRAKFLIYELKKENEELRKVNLSNEQFEVQQMKLELKSMKKQMDLVGQPSFLPSHWVILIWGCFLDASEIVRFISSKAHASGSWTMDMSLT
ncbi:hypothetical protein GQ457_07G003310 [Hibiscus cannabinus]